MSQKLRLKVRPIEEKDRQEVYDLWAYSVLVEYQENLFWEFLQKDRIRCILVQVMFTAYILSMNLLYGSTINLLLILFLYYMSRQVSRDFMKKFAFLKNKSDIEKRKFLVAENFDENDECIGIYGAVGYNLSFAPREFKKRTLLPPLVVVDFIVVAQSARRNGVGMKLMEEVEKRAYKKQINVFAQTFDPAAKSFFKERRFLSDVVEMNELFVRQSWFNKLFLALIGCQGQSFIKAIRRGGSVADINEISTK